jgi:hypothetical protein
MCENDNIVTHSVDYCTTANMHFFVLHSSYLIYTYKYKLAYIQILMVTYEYKYFPSLHSCIFIPFSYIDVTIAVIYML